MNMKILRTAEKISAILEEIASPSRLVILLSIGDGEACVCHLESVLNKRQAYISQHLMALRQAGIITSRRDGRFIYYRLADPALLVAISMTDGVGTGFCDRQLEIGDRVVAEAAVAQQAGQGQSAEHHELAPRRYVQ